MNGLASSGFTFSEPVYRYTTGFNDWYNQNFSDWTKSLSSADIAKLSNNTSGLASSANNAQNIQWATRGPEFSAGLSSSVTGQPAVLNNEVTAPTWWDQNGGMIKGVGGAAMATAGTITAINDMIRNNKLFKEQKRNFEMQREIARENLAMQRAEYNRLKTNRANLSKVYGA